MLRSGVKVEVKLMRDVEVGMLCMEVLLLKELLLLLLIGEMGTETAVELLLVSVAAAGIVELVIVEAQLVDFVVAGVAVMAER